MNDFHSVYGLDADPFRLTPDPSFRFAHAAFAKAAEAVRRAAQGGEGIVMVTGKPGTGKTTLIEDFLAELDPAKVTRAVLTSTQLGADDLLRTIGHAFSLHPRDGDKASVAAAIEQFLRRQAEARRRTILVVDEAQNLSVDALEELRVLSTLHDGSRPLLEVLLVGQEQLLETLRLAELELLSQRIVEAVRLGTLDADETRSYIEHRLNHAGWQGKPQLSDDAYQLIHLLSRGLPRYINKLCARLLVHGSVEAKEALDAQDVLVVGREMRDELLMPAFADADLDIQAAIDELAELQDGLEEEAHGAVQPDPAEIGDAVEGPAKITTSIDRAYRPAAPEPGAADDGMAPSAAQSGPTTADAGGTSVANRRPPRTATDRALVGAIVLLILAVGYGIWRHHPAFRKAIEPGTGMPVVTHPATPAAPVRAEGAVDREAPSNRNATAVSAPLAP
ncbi:MAG: AAA family ATPase, partial [Gammaproteobacteria bacterium]